MRLSGKYRTIVAEPPIYGCNDPEGEWIAELKRETGENPNHGPSWKHSLACAWRDGEECTCKEPEPDA